MKTKIFILFALLLIGCGSKKISTKTDIKEKAEFDLTDNSVISSKVEQEAQYTNATTNERIVTMYGVRFDTIQVEGKPYVIPIYYPEQKIEDRTINVDNFIWRMNTQDSIRKAVSLEFKGTLEGKEKKISELKESTMVYQIALLIISIFGIIVLVLYIIAKIKSRMIGF
jgi:hypothetical protein